MKLLDRHDYRCFLMNSSKIFILTTFLFKEACPTVIERTNYWPFEIFKSDEEALQKVQNIAHTETFQQENGYRDGLVKSLIFPSAIPINTEPRRAIRQEVHNQKNEVNNEEIKNIYLDNDSQMNTNYRMYGDSGHNIRLNRNDHTTSEKSENDLLLKLLAKKFKHIDRGILESILTSIKSLSEAENKFVSLTPLKPDCGGIVNNFREDIEIPYDGGQESGKFETDEFTLEEDDNQENYNETPESNRYITEDRLFNDQPLNENQDQLIYFNEEFKGTDNKSQINTSNNIEKDKKYNSMSEKFIKYKAKMKSQLHDIDNNISRPKNEISMQDYVYTDIKTGGSTRTKTNQIYHSSQQDPGVAERKSKEQHQIRTGQLRDSKLEQISPISYSSVFPSTKSSLLDKENYLNKKNLDKKDFGFKEALEGRNRILKTRISEKYLSDDTEIRDKLFQFILSNADRIKQESMLKEEKHPNNEKRKTIENFETYPLSTDRAKDTPESEHNENNFWDGMDELTFKIKANMNESSQEERMAKTKNQDKVTKESEKKLIELLNNIIKSNNYNSNDDQNPECKNQDFNHLNNTTGTTGINENIQGGIQEYALINNTENYPENEEKIIELLQIVSNIIKSINPLVNNKINYFPPS